MKIYASDGKEFEGNENGFAMCNAHELDIKKQKEKEEAERKKKEEAKEYKYSQVIDKIDSLNKVVESYEKETGEKLECVTINGKLSVQKANMFFKDPYTYMNFHGTDTKYLRDRLYEILKNYCIDTL